MGALLFFCVLACFLYTSLLACGIEAKPFGRWSPWYLTITSAQCSPCSVAVCFCPHNYIFYELGLLMIVKKYIYISKKAHNVVVGMWLGNKHRGARPLFYPFWPFLENPVSFALYCVFGEYRTFGAFLAEKVLNSVCPCMRSHSQFPSARWALARRFVGGQQLGKACTRCTQCCKKWGF